MVVSLLIALAATNGQVASVSSELERPSRRDIHLDFGRQVFRAKKGVDRVQGLDRVVIGIWTDGIRAREVEEVVFLSPELLARWEGWLAASGKTASPDTLEKWRKTPKAIVKLSILERNDSFELADISATRPVDLDNVSCSWETPEIKPEYQLVPEKGLVEIPGVAPRTSPLNPEVIWDRFGIRPEMISTIPWFGGSEQLKEFWPQGWNVPEWDGLQRGKNRTLVFSIDLPDRDNNLWEHGGTLTIWKGKKRLVAQLRPSSKRTFKVPRPGK